MKRLILAASVMAFASTVSAQPQLASDLSGNAPVDAFMFGQGQLELAQFLAAQCERHEVDVTFAATDHARRDSVLQEFLGDRDETAIADEVRAAHIKVTDMIQEYMVERELTTAEASDQPACRAIDAELAEGTHLAQFFQR